MPDSKRRQYLEAALSKAISVAEEQAFNDPKTQKLIQDLRTMYREGSEEFMVALGLSSAPATRSRPALPESRIPQLLLVLDTLAQGRNISLPARRSNSNMNPQPLISNLVLPKTPMVPKKPAAPAVSSFPITEKREINLEGIRRLEVEIQSLVQQYQAIKQEEESIRFRRGKYAIPMERLKAERLLRELPGRITEAANRKKMLEDGVL